MAWHDTLQDASFRGVPFHVQSVSDRVQRSIGSSEYPYREGAVLEDLGLRAWRFQVKGILFGDDYEGQLDDLVTALEAKGVGELSHPVWGRLQVIAADWTLDHDADLVDGVALRIEFVEQGTADPKVFASTTASSQADDLASAASAARAAADDALANKMQAVSVAPARRLSVLRDSFNQAKAALTRLTDTSALRAVLTDLDPILYPRAYAADLFAVVDRALQGLPFGGRNLLFDSSSGASVVDGPGAGDFQTVVNTCNPADLTVTSTAGVSDPDMDGDAAFVQAHLRVHAACAIAEAFVMVLAGEVDKALLDRADLERMAATTRQAIQTALNDVRNGMGPDGRGAVSSQLATLAAKVLKGTMKVINQRPPLVRKPSPVSGPVRLVAHALYGDGDRATEIVRLNRLGRSVAVDRGQELMVYAA